MSKQGELDDLHIKISNVLSKYLSNVPMREEDAIALVDEIANLLSAQHGMQADEAKADREANMPCPHCGKLVEVAAQFSLRR